QLAQVPVVPGRLDAVKQRRRLDGAVPADTEPVPVRRLGSELRMKALVDEGVGRLVQELLEEDRRPRICEPTTHTCLLSCPICCQDPTRGSPTKSARRPSASAAARSS